MRDLEVSFCRPLCYESIAHCPLLQYLRTTSAIVTGAHSYFAVSSLKCEGKNSCHDLIRNLRIKTVPHHQSGGCSARGNTGQNKDTVHTCWLTIPS